MNASSRAIVIDYEENQASVEQIAESLEVNVEAVEAVLLQFSKKYREATKSTAVAKREDIDDDEYHRIFEAYKSLGWTTEDERLKAKIFKNCIDEKKGRLDWRERALKAGKGMSPTQINVFVFNRALSKAREEKAAKVIDVMTEIANTPN